MFVSLRGGIYVCLFWEISWGKCPGSLNESVEISPNLWEDIIHLF